MKEATANALIKAMTNAVKEEIMLRYLADAIRAESGVCLDGEHDKALGGLKAAADSMAKAACLISEVLETFGVSTVRIS